jgi:CheY-like chemotaxis protein
MNPAAAAMHVTNTRNNGARALIEGGCFAVSRKALPLAFMDGEDHGSWAAEGNGSTERLKSAGTLSMAGCREKSADRPATILLIDDDAIDVSAIRRAIGELRIVNPVVAARDGVEALEMLRGENGHAKLGTPLLILLDLHMPRMDGIEFLEELRGDPDLRRTMVFVMTGSASEDDKERAYEYNIAGYVPKSGPARSLVQSIAALENYWRTIELPD